MEMMGLVTAAEGLGKGNKSLKQQLCVTARNPAVYAGAYPVPCISALFF